MKKITVLGAGMVGSAIAKDLSQAYQVTIVDFQQKSLSPFSKLPIATLLADLSQAENIKRAILGADLVIGAVPGYLGFQMLKTVLKNKKNIVDISFFDEDPFELDELAKKNQVTAIVDCGVAPGMSHMILGYHNTLMELSHYECLVGGLPFTRDWPWQYKAPFSPIDVIEEYTREARFVIDGSVVTKEALSDAEIVEIPPVGELESFNTDGLRSLIKTMKVPNMIEKTLRYPGHIELVKVLKDGGFFNKEPIKINDVEISPHALTSRLLIPKWKLGMDDKEFTIMRVRLKGKEKGVAKEIEYLLYDTYDDFSQTSSMARTTGYTCSAAANLVLSGKFDKKGISPPEYLGALPSCFKYILEYLQERNIIYQTKG